MKPRSRVLARHAENFKVLCPVVQSKFTFRDSHFPLSASQFKPFHLHYIDKEVNILGK